MFKFMNFQNKSWQWLLLVFLALIWGSSFILMKKGLQSFSNFQVGAFRIFFSFVIFLPLLLQRYKRIKKHHLFPLAIVGFLGNGIPAILFPTAQSHISSSLAGMLNSLTPFFTLVVGVWIYKSKAKWFNALGIIIGLIGALGLIMPTGNEGIMIGFNWYAMLAVVATFCYGISTNETKYSLKDLDGVTIAAGAFAITGPFATIYLLFSDFSAVIQTPDYLINLGFIALLSIFSSVIAIIIFNNLIKFTTAIFAASVTYIIPIFAMAWGWFDGEIISATQFFWITIIMMGVYLVNKKSDIKILTVIDKPVSDEKSNITPKHLGTPAPIYLLSSEPDKKTKD